MAVIMSIGEAGVQQMQVGLPQVQFLDITGHVEGVVETDVDACGEFVCTPGKVSVWVPVPRPTQQLQRQLGSSPR
jgi:hypothetical protein